MTQPDPNTDPSTSTENTNPQTGSDSNAGKTGDQANLSVSKAEYDQLLERMKAADRRAAAEQKAKEELAAKIAEAEKATLTDIEKAKRDAEEALKAREETAIALRSERLRNAFLAAEGNIQWQDPSDAYAILLRDFMEGVEIAEDGKVTGMKEAVAALAKKKSYLVKTGIVQPAPEATGSGSSTRKGANPDQAAADAERRRRFPAAFRGQKVG
jgi:hypothetical protein